jgi:hypothetical protein
MQGRQRPPYFNPRSKADRLLSSPSRPIVMQKSKVLHHDEGRMTNGAVQKGAGISRTMRINLIWPSLIMRPTAQSPPRKIVIARGPGPILFV